MVAFPGVSVELPLLLLLLNLIYLHFLFMSSPRWISQLSLDCLFLEFISQVVVKADYASLLRMSTYSKALKDRGTLVRRFQLSRLFSRICWIEAQCDEWCYRQDRGHVTSRPSWSQYRFPPNLTSTTASTLSRASTPIIGIQPTLLFPPSLIETTMDLMNFKPKIRSPRVRDGMCEGVSSRDSKSSGDIIVVQNPTPGRLPRPNSRNQDHVHGKIVQADTESPKLRTDPN